MAIAIFWGSWFFGFSLFGFWFLVLTAAAEKAAAAAFLFFSLLYLCQSTKSEKYLWLAKEKNISEKFRKALDFPCTLC